jgi:hypothetical protein
MATVDVCASVAIVQAPAARAVAMTIAEMRANMVVDAARTRTIDAGAEQPELAGGPGCR